MMCYSFFFFIIINYSHHQTDVAMFVSVTHQSREDPQVLLAMSAGCGWLSLSIFFYREKKKRKDIQHDMTLTRRQLNTTPLNESIIHSNAQTRMIEWQNRIYLFVLCFFFLLVWSSFFTPKYTQQKRWASMNTNYWERQSNSSLELTHRLSIQMRKR